MSLSVGARVNQGYVVGEVHLAADKFGYLARVVHLRRQLGRKALFKALLDDGTGHRVRNLSDSIQLGERAALLDFRWHHAVGYRLGCSIEHLVSDCLDPRYRSSQADTGKHVHYSRVDPTNEVPRARS
jgi:hypothetical protein